MKYITVTEAAQRAGVSRTRIIALCKQNRIFGVVKFGSGLAIPDDFKVSPGKRGPKFQKIKQ